MSHLSRPMTTEDDAGGHEPPSMPWDRRPSILEFVRSHISTDQPGMMEGGYTLPDEERIRAGSIIRWSAGAMDGVTTHHTIGSENDEAVSKTVELVLAYCRQPTAMNSAAVYQHIIGEQVVSIMWSNDLLKLRTQRSRIGCFGKDFGTRCSTNILPQYVRGREVCWSLSAKTMWIEIC
jgi:hypothetical protein